MKRPFCIIFLTISWMFHPAIGQTFPYTTPPDSITNTQQRYDYASIHFWDNVKFTDSIIPLDVTVLLNYGYLLSNTSAEKQKIALSKLFDSIALHSDIFWHVMVTFDRLYHRTDSQHYNDELFYIIINEAMNSNITNEIKRTLQPLYNLVARNRLGLKADNFVFMTINGDEHDLYDITADKLLIIFNNPECSHCQELEFDITTDLYMQQLIDDGKLVILSISVIGDIGSWEKHQYPDNWITGFDKTEILDKQLYDIQYLPALYLLDSDKHVILKQASLEVVKEHL